MMRCLFPVPLTSAQEDSSARRRFMCVAAQCGIFCWRIPAPLSNGLFFTQQLLQHETPIPIELPSADNGRVNKKARKNWEFVCQALRCRSCCGPVLKSRDQYSCVECSEIVADVDKVLDTVAEADRVWQRALEQLKDNQLQGMIQPRKTCF